MLYKRTILQHLSDSLGGRISWLGEILKNDLLIYNPLTFKNFHRTAVHNAPKVIDALQASFPEAEKYLDVGCGSGAYAAEFLRKGLDIKAIEYSSYARKMAKKQGLDCRKFDLRHNPPCNLDDLFDVAYCFEVAEHIPENLSDNLVDFLVKKAPICVFTAATPSQTGMGHINCQPREYWEQKFYQKGYSLSKNKTETLQKQFKEYGIVYWLTNNISVYIKD